MEELQKNPVKKLSVIKVNLDRHRIGIVDIKRNEEIEDGEKIIVEFRPVTWYPADNMQQMEHWW